LAVAGRFGARLKLGIVTAALLASSGVVYYSAVYVPRRDAALESERMLKQARADADKRAAQQRLLAQQSAAQQRQADGRAAAQARYQACLADAGAVHDASWAAACKQNGDKVRQDHDDCLAKLHLPRSYCDSAYTVSDDSPQCTLPSEIATVLDAALQRARNQCLRDSQAAVQ
jgi:hypothetical protein